MVALAEKKNAKKKFLISEKNIKVNFCQLKKQLQSRPIELQVFVD